MEVWIGFVLLGVVVGAYGTMIGAGGGFVLVPILLLLDRSGRATPENVTAVSLAMVLVNAISGTIAYARMRRIHYRAGLMFAAATIPGAILGVIVIHYIQFPVFSVVMAIFLLGIGVMLVIRPRESNRNAQPACADGGPPPRPTFPFNRALGISLSGGIGVLASLLGVGGGIIHVPALTGLLHFPVHVATATSTFVLVFTALAATAMHLWNHTLPWSIAPSPGALQLDVLHCVLPLVVGVVPGAQLGAMLARKIHGRWILRALGLALAAVAVRLLTAAW